MSGQHRSKLALTGQHRGFERRWRNKNRSKMTHWTSKMSCNTCLDARHEWTATTFGPGKIECSEKHTYIYIYVYYFHLIYKWGAFPTWRKHIINCSRQYMRAVHACRTAIEQLCNCDILHKWAENNKSKTNKSKNQTKHRNEKTDKKCICLHAAFFFSALTHRLSRMCCRKRYLIVCCCELN